MVQRQLAFFLDDYRIKFLITPLNKNKMDNKKIDFLGDAKECKEDFIVVTPRDWDARRFKIACAMLPEMARECYEEGLEMTDAVADAVRFADLLIEELKK